MIKQIAKGLFHIIYIHNYLFFVENILKHKTTAFKSRLLTHHICLCRLTCKQKDTNNIYPKYIICFRHFVHANQNLYHHHYYNILTNFNLTVISLSITSDFAIPAWSAKPIYIGQQMSWTPLIIIYTNYIHHWLAFKFGTRVSKHILCYIQEKSALSTRYQIIFITF